MAFLKAGIASRDPLRHADRQDLHLIEIGPPEALLPSAEQRIPP